ncbi:MAG: hypothetical protein ABFR63_03975 [Thermodesulfobacteriota bacterium]
MGDSSKVKLTIKFVDGSQESYSFERQMTEENKYVWLDKIHEQLEAKNLVIELGGKLQIFPVANILRIEIEPPPPKLPPTCIRGAVQG